MATAILIFGALVCLAGGSASADVPMQMPFQGLLLDSAGDPVNAAVDLDFELFDAVSGGSSLWTESHLGVTVVDGVYSVDLGSQAPLTPETLSGGSVFLEITVSGETLVPRQQLLSVPYALVAERVGTTSALFLEQMVESFPFDGQEPPNNHPDEGTADSDGDGIPNFIDPDNDEDGIDDAAELALGRPINVANPTIAGVAPTTIASFSQTALVVSGFGLNTVSTVSFGSEAPTPTAITPTSFVVAVTAETVSTSESLIVTLANGQSAISSPVTIGAVAPTIDRITPAFATAGQSNVLTIYGTGFYPGTTVQVGAQNLVPSALSATEMTVTMAATSVGPVTVTVNHPNQLTADRPYQVTTADARIVFLTSTTLNGSFSSVAAGDTICQVQAGLAGLPGTYRAWLSESLESPTTQSPATTFPTNVGPYLRVDSVTVADDWTDLTNGDLQAPIRVTAQGDLVTSSGGVWTGTNSDGTARAIAGETCQEWSTITSGGISGLSSSTGAAWSTLFAPVDCNSAFRLYCFQQ